MTSNNWRLTNGKSVLALPPSKLIGAIRQASQEVRDDQVGRPAVRGDQVGRHGVRGDQVGRWPLDRLVSYPSKY